MAGCYFRLDPNRDNFRLEGVVDSDILVSGQSRNCDSDWASTSSSVQSASWLLQVCGLDLLVDGMTDEIRSTGQRDQLKGSATGSLVMEPPFAEASSAAP